MYVCMYVCVFIICDSHSLCFFTLTPVYVQSSVVDETDPCV